VGCDVPEITCPPVHSRGAMMARCAATTPECRKISSPQNPTLRACVVQQSSVLITTLQDAVKADASWDLLFNAKCNRTFRP